MSVVAVKLNVLLNVLEAEKGLSLGFTQGWMGWNLSLLWLLGTQGHAQQEDYGISLMRSQPVSILKFCFNNHCRNFFYHNLWIKAGKKKKRRNPFWEKINSTWLEIKFQDLSKITWKWIWMWRKCRKNQNSLCVTTVCSDQGCWAGLLLSGKVFFSEHQCPLLICRAVPISETNEFSISYRSNDALLVDRFKWFLTQVGYW